MWVEVRAKGHETGSRSRQRTQVKGTKEMKRKDGK